MGTLKISTGTQDPSTTPLAPATGRETRLEAVRAAMAGCPHDLTAEDHGWLDADLGSSSDVMR